MKESEEYVRAMHMSLCSRFISVVGYSEVYHVPFTIRKATELYRDCSTGGPLPGR